MQYEEAINFGDLEYGTSLFDARSLALRVAESIGLNEQESEDLARVFQQNPTIDQLMEQQIDMVHSSFGYATVLRVHSIDGVRGPLVRYDLGPDGFNYVMLVVEDSAAAGPRIVDLFVGTNGENLSQTIGAVAQLLVDPSPSLLSRLFGAETIDTDLQQKLQTMTRQVRETQFADAYATINSLPDEVRNHRAITSISTQVASMIDEATYERELARLAALHGDDPRTAFLLIDYYFLRGDMEAAMESVETLESVFGFDAAIALFKSTISLQLGDVDAAVRFAEAAFEVEPYDENSFWAMLNVSLATERYAAAIEAMEVLEIDFGYLFDAEVMATEETYSGFIESAEYETWAASRSAN